MRTLLISDHLFLVMFVYPDLTLILFCFLLFLLLLFFLLLLTIFKPQNAEISNFGRF